MDDPLEDHIHILVKVKPISKSMRSPVDRPLLTKVLSTTFVLLSLYYSHHCTSWFRSSSSFLCHPPILTSPFIFPSLFAHSLFTSISSITHFILLLWLVFCCRLAWCWPYHLLFVCNNVIYLFRCLPKHDSLIAPDCLLLHVFLISLSLYIRKPMILW